MPAFAVSTFLQACFEKKILIIQHQVVNFFTLSGGIKSPLYFNLKNLSSYPSLRSSQLVQYLADVICNHFPRVNFILGVATGSIGLGAQIAQILKIGYGYVRKQTKGYGMQSLVEGDIRHHHHVLMIEDVITTGQLVWQAYHNAQQNYRFVHLLGIVSLFNYQLTTAVCLFAHHAITLFSLITLNDIIHWLHQQNQLLLRQAVIEFRSSFSLRE